MLLFVERFASHRNGKENRGVGRGGPQDGVFLGGRAQKPPNQLRLAGCACSPLLDKNGTELKSSTIFVALSHDQSPSLCMQYTF